MAHIPSWNGPNGPADMGNPQEHLSFNEWWFHGQINNPPDEGVFLEVPNGGKMPAQVASNRAFTKFPEYGVEYDDELDTLHLRAEDGRMMAGLAVDGSIHIDTGIDRYGMPVAETRDVRGCGFSIAYNSNPHALKPEGFAVISTNHKCVFNRDIEFDIPAGLPPCPAGGCHCMWGWVHSANSGSSQMYTNVFRCNVTNADPNGMPIPPPQVARKCPFDKNNCTVGSRQMHYWIQNEGNNNWQNPHDPPFYNDDYGFPHGAQTDLWAEHKVWDDNVVSPSDWAPPTLETYTASNPAITPATAPLTTKTAPTETPKAGAIVTGQLLAHGTSSSSSVPPASSTVVPESATPSTAVPSSVVPSSAAPSPAAEESTTTTTTTPTTIITATTTTTPSTTIASTAATTT
jgi:hypothetical protein